MTTPAIASVDLRAHIVTLALAWAPTGKVFACEPRIGSGYPVDATFVWDAPGPPPRPVLSHARSIWQHAVQVRVRAEPLKMAIARVNATTLMRALHRATVTGYMSCLVRESSPIHLGQNSAGQYEFGFNVEMVRSGT
jgi:hypothetical protein